MDFIRGSELRLTGSSTEGYVLRVNGDSLLWFESSAAVLSFVAAAATAGKAVAEHEQSLAERN